MLTTVYKNEFAQQPVLRVLRLDGNRIAELEVGCFNGLVGLQELHMSHNHLTTIPIRLMSASSALLKIDWSANIVTRIDDAVLTTSVAEVPDFGNPLTCPRQLGADRTHGFVFDFVNCTCTNGADAAYRLRVLPPHTVTQLDDETPLVVKNEIRRQTGENWTRPSGAVCDRLVFKAAPSWNQEAEVARAGFRHTYTAGNTYDTEPIRLSKPDLFVDYFGDVDSILYRLNFANGTLPGKFLVDSAVGATIAEPRVAGSYSVELEAVDAAGKVATVLAWVFSVVPAEKFSTIPAWDPQAEAVLAGVKGVYLLNTSYSTPAVRLDNSDLFLHCAEDDCTTITYKLVFPGGRSPGTFLVSSSGATLASPA